MKKTPEFDAKFDPIVWKLKCMQKTPEFDANQSSLIIAFSNIASSINIQNNLIDYSFRWIGHGEQKVAKVKAKIMSFLKSVLNWPVLSFQRAPENSPLSPSVLVLHA